MAKFIFSMQSLLNIKEKLEEQEKNNFSRAMLLLQEAEAELRELQNRQREAEEELRDKMLSALDVQEIRRCENAVEVMKMYIRQQQMVVLQHQRNVEAARRKLNEAMKQRKIYEKLREKAFEEFKIEENRKEQKEVDELVSYRYGSAANEE